jgi:hypothetical protein
MKNCKRLRGMLIVPCLLVSNLETSFPQDKAAPGAVQVHVVITS